MLSEQSHPAKVVLAAAPLRVCMTLLEPPAAAHAGWCKAVATALEWLLAPAFAQKVVMQALKPAVFHSSLAQGSRYTDYVTEW